VRFSQFVVVLCLDDFLSYFLNFVVIFSLSVDQTAPLNQQFNCFLVLSFKLNRHYLYVVTVLLDVLLKHLSQQSH